MYPKHGGNIFSVDTLMNHPEDFYEIVRTCFGIVKSGSCKPTLTHHFLKLLSEKNLLQRVYTQNVDMLEEMAGIPTDKIVQAHGTFARSYCTKCLKPKNSDDFWKEILDKKVPRCDTCSSIARPDVTFFGEPLDPKFFKFCSKDFIDCDYLIIIGTSLMVFPFASLVNKVGELVPRLLINKDPTGPFKQMPKEGEKPGARYRDCVSLGDCDETVKNFVRLMNWEKDFEKLTAVDVSQEGDQKG
eukprot:UN32750